MSQQTNMDAIENKAQLPTVLHRTVTKNILWSCTFILICIALAIYEHNRNYAIGFLIGGFLIIKSLLLMRSWRQGEIVEIALRCVNVETFAIKLLRHAAVTFTDADDNLYDFVVPQKSYRFRTNTVYVLYYYKCRPKEIIAYKAIINADTQR